MSPKKKTSQKKPRKTHPSPTPEKQKKSNRKQTVWQAQASADRNKKNIYISDRWKKIIFSGPRLILTEARTPHCLHGHRPGRTSSTGSSTRTPSDLRGVPQSLRVSFSFVRWAFGEAFRSINSAGALCQCA